MQYVEMHGGRVRVESKVGEGSTFTVTLPFQQPSPATTVETPVSEATPEATSDEDHVGVLILCLDNDDDSRQLLKLTLEEESGYQVIAAKSFDSAIALADAHNPDLICLDLNMPSRNGREVTDALASDSATAGIPIIFLSSPDVASKRKGLDPDRVLAKPGDTTLMLAMIENAVTSNIGSVLLVQSESEARDSLAQSLADRGIRTWSASNNEEGLEQLSRNEPTAIVLDVDSQHDDALECLNALSSEETYARLPVVAITQLELSAELSEAISRQVDCLLDKNELTPAKVVAAILMACKRRRHTVEAARV